MGPSWGPKRPGALVSCTPKPPLSVGLQVRSSETMTKLAAAIQQKDVAEIIATPPHTG